ncbi:AraC family transcriptional regulator [Duganella violaceipulchra]|uniref:AraC-like DNA-binding protein n=1 Tax=Duganella violaceipulchra TaxID=2849652 RepID=A0ABT1GL86_9BURK|nr:AraC-like DNA-binding protein [Duganella violaceicalia]
MIYVDPAWLNDKVLHGQVPSGYLHLFRQPLRQDPELAREILSRHRMIQRSGLSLERETILIELLARVFGRYGLPVAEKDASEREAVRRVKQRLDLDFDQDITLTELGTLVDMDPLYLIRVFRQEVGISPHSYQLQRRIARAAVSAQRHEHRRRRVCLWLLRPEPYGAFLQKDRRRHAWRVSRRRHVGPPDRVRLGLSRGNVCRMR